MKYSTSILLFLLIVLFSCTDNRNVLKQESCVNSKLNNDLNYNDLISEIPSNIIEALVERPDSNGALGRNKEGYFHVRFQMEMTRLTDYAIKFHSKEAVYEFLKNLNYSFSHQQAAGDFEWVIPDEFLNAPNYIPPSEADLVSGTAFFAYSVGMSLMTLNQSQWYTESSSLNELKSQIQTLNPNILNMLAYLKNNSALLEVVDEYAPNRLFFNAVAFYSLGIILNDEEAKNLGIHFAEKALLQRNRTEGYFIEAGGWDSSYNGVAIKLGFELLTLSPNDSNQTIKEELEQAVTCATHWQKSRILPNGAISTDGNTRVFPGGEDFLGNEKQVDVVKTLKAFFYMHTLSGRNEYEWLTQKIIEHYE